MILYIHKNKINGKVYIGISSKKLNNRSGPEGKEYLRKKNGKFIQPKFAEAILKYGWDNFDHIVLLENLTENDAKSSEIEYIKKYDSINNGYNILEGGSLPPPMTKERKEYLSEIHKGEKNKMYHKEVTEETRKKISLALTGIKRSDETIRKMSKCKKGKNNPMYGNHSGKGKPKVFSKEDLQKFADRMKGNTYRKNYKMTEEEKLKLSLRIRGENHPMYGKHFSDDHKRKLSLANKKYSETHTIERHGKKLENLTTGKIYDFISDAAKEFGIDPKKFNSKIYRSIKSNQPAYGYYWKIYPYKKDSEE